MRWGVASLPLCGLLAIALAGFGASSAIAQIAVTGASTSTAATAPNSDDVAHTQPPVNVAERLLAVQNAERSKLGLPLLVWSTELAKDAEGYAQVLLSKGALEHSSSVARKGKGENLWMGTAGAWDPDAMIGMFLDERRYFRAAPFPDVSLTGNWSDVGHYTQIVWKDTKEVGCALDSGNGMDVLVCRYSPAGNVFGKTPF